MIIGLVGYAGSGKSTIARELTAFGYNQRKFAAPLKEMILSLLKAQGCHKLHAQRLIEGDLKELPSPYFGGKTPRHAMQTLGTDWGRAMLNEDLWCEAAMRDLKEYAHYVFDDVRFTNEANLIRQMRGHVVRLHRPGVERSSNHPSENLPWADIDVTNDRTPRQVAEQIMHAVKHFPSTETA